MPTQPPISTTRSSHLVSSSVESYIQGWGRPSIRAAIHDALAMFDHEDDAVAQSTLANGLELADHLQEIAKQIDQIAAGVRKRAMEGSGVMPRVDLARVDAGR